MKTLNTYLSCVLSLLFMTFSQASWALKSIELDQAKSLESKAECQRIAQWRLIPGVQVYCGMDNLKFSGQKSDVASNTYEKVRLGNFNLLHPGTDKTLFKDLDLMAKLINGQFDVMAGIEFVDVVSDAKKGNDKLRAIMERKFQSKKEIEEKVSAQQEKVAAIEARIAASNAQTTTGTDLTREAKIRHLRFEIARDSDIIGQFQRELLKINYEIIELSRPGFTLLGWEIFKAKRLARLRPLPAKKTAVLSEIKSWQQHRELLKLELTKLEQRTDVMVAAGNNEQDEAELKAEKEILEKLKVELNEKSNNFSRYAAYYRVPGYLDLLIKLRDLDPSWSLIVSPHGDALEESHTQELVGFYYRADRADITNNVHCQTRFGQTSEGCYPNFYANDSAELFSRRPFMTSFKSGSFNFSMLAAHVIFESPKNEARRKEMLKKSFGVEDINALGTGITKDNFARFVEVNATLDMIKKLKEEGLGHIIYTGDFNLESTLPFWKKILVRHPELKILIDDETSLSEMRFANGVETNGVSNNYDHFILGQEDSENCNQASSVDFKKGEVAELLKQKYLVREEAAKGPYALAPDAESKITQLTEEIRPRLERYNFVLNDAEEIGINQKVVDKDLANFKERVFESQTSDKTYYKLFVQIMSDHLPIRLDCRL